MTNERILIMKKGKPSALLPIAVFLVFYLGLGIYSEYILKIPMGFYNIPIVVAFLAAILVACLQNRSVPFEEKLALMGQGIGDKNIITMLLIFLAAGTFVGVVGRSSAESVAYFMLSWIPAKYAVAVLFVVACFVSTAMGTSVGTITLLVPIAAAVAETSGFSLALCVASVMFRENFWIALPAALATLALILVISFRQAPGTPIVHEYHLQQMVPYLLVLIGGIAGIQVFVVLLIGIASGAVIMLGTGQTTLLDMLSSMGSGTSGMFETCMVAILVAAMCALIRENGGFTVLLRAIHKIFRGKKGGQLGVGILVALLDIATANNTVAIVMANPIAKQMSEDYGITPRKTASLLDTFSCISQGILPYGAQMLVAISAVHELGYELSAFEIMANLFYPGMLLVSSLIFIFVLPDRKNAESNA